MRGFAAPAGAPGPPRQPRQGHLVHDHRTNQLGVTLCQRQGDVAAVAVPEHDGRATVDEGDEIGDVGIDRERSAGAMRAGVAPAVVAQHAELLVETPRQQDHRRRAIHRPVDEGDQRRLGSSRLV